MSVELPYAPVDDLIRRNSDGLRVSSGATEELARRIQAEGARRANEAAHRADEHGRKTLMMADFGVEVSPNEDALVLPIAPVDRVARLEIDGRYRVAMDARVALAEQLEMYADTVAAAAAILTRHAGRQTIKAADIETYFELKQYYA